MNKIVFMMMAVASAVPVQRINACSFVNSSQMIGNESQTCIINESEKICLLPDCEGIKEFVNVSELQNPVVKLSGPFKGVWNMKDGDSEGKLTLDLYNKSVTGMSADGDDIKCYGTIYVCLVYGASIRVDECPILECQPEGNKATIKFVGGRDGNTYQAVLTFDPKTKKITVSDRKRLGEEEFGECYVDDGLVFSK